MRSDRQGQPLRALHLQLQLFVGAAIQGVAEGERRSRRQRGGGGGAAIVV